MSVFSTHCGHQVEGGFAPISLIHRVGDGFRNRTLRRAGHDEHTFADGWKAAASHSKAPITAVPGLPPKRLRRCAGRRARRGSTTAIPADHRRRSIWCLDVQRPVDITKAAPCSNRRRRVLASFGEQFGNRNAEPLADLIKLVVGQRQPVMLDFRQVESGIPLCLLICFNVQP
jgi:hypothetical protein